MITLTHNGTTVPLHAEPDAPPSWIDEFDWSPVKQTAEYSVSGSLILDAATMQAGRPITLQGTESFGWVARGTLATLKAWEAIPGARLALSIHGQPFAVVFDHDSKGIQAQPVADYADAQTTDLMTVTYRFLEAPAT